MKSLEHNRAPFIEILRHLLLTTNDYVAGYSAKTI